MKRRKYVLITIVVLLIVGTAIYKYTYKEHINIAKSDADFKLNSNDLLQFFSKDVDAATKKYLNKIIQVTGTVSEQDSESMTLNSGILCYFLNLKPTTTKLSLKIKGRCIGYDELLEVVKLDQCTILE